MYKFLRSLFVPYAGKFSNLWILALIQAVIFAVLWNVFPNKDIPSFAQIAHSWNEQALNDGLLLELLSSIKTITYSLVASSIISLSIVYLSTAVFFKPAAFMISAFRFLGFAGFTYLFTVWTSSATELKLWLLTFGMTVFLVTNMLAEVEAITQDSVDYVKTLKFRGWRITWENVVLGKMHIMLDCIRQNAAIGWTMLTMVEGLTRSQGGIGTMLTNQNRHFDLAGIIAIQITILLYGVFQDVILGAIKNALCPYATMLKVQ